MFNLEKFYEECSTGKKVDCTEVYKYIKQFKYVIIRGAAAQGAAIGRKLQEAGIEITVYWDIRAEELCSVNGVPVELPFSTKFEPTESIIIHAIPNHVIMGQFMQEFHRAGYKNIIIGNFLYTATNCTYSLGDRLSVKKCWQSGGECRSIICKKAGSIIKNYSSEIKEGERIDLTYCCFIINSICNLSCRDCVQYVPNYPTFARGNVPFEVISRDVDIFFDMIDSVGTISVMGGETFLHPDIVKITNKFAEKKNFGFVCLPTNGLHPIKPEQLEGIEDPRVIVAFGYYLHRANEQQKEIYYKNIELVKKYKIAYMESVYVPTWMDPGKLNKTHTDEVYMTNLKQSCKMPPRNLQVKNGKVHTCDKGVAIYNMGIADYPTDYLDLTQNVSRLELRNKFREFIDRKFYYTCGHCNMSNRSIESAIQGKKEIL